VGFDFRPATYEIEGVRFTYYVSADGNGRIAIQPPDVWNVAGGRLVPRRPGLGEIIIQAERSVDGVLMEKGFDVNDEENVAAWTQFLRRRLPSEAVEVEMIGADAMFGRLEQTQLFEFRFRYLLGNEEIERSVVVWPRENDLVLFTYSNQVEDFARSWRDFRSTIYSVHVPQ